MAEVATRRVDIRQSHRVIISRSPYGLSQGLLRGARSLPAHLETALELTLALDRIRPPSRMARLALRTRKDPR
jgi:hypothetical protein